MRLRSGLELARRLRSVAVEVGAGPSTRRPFGLDGRFCCTYYELCAARVGRVRAHPIPFSSPNFCNRSLASGGRLSGNGTVNLEGRGRGFTSDCCRAAAASRQLCSGSKARLMRVCGARSLAVSQPPPRRDTRLTYLVFGMPCLCAPVKWNLARVAGASFPHRGPIVLHMKLACPHTYLNT